jgi:hypothetical protein
VFLRAEPDALRKVMKIISDSSGSDDTTVPALLKRRTPRHDFSRGRCESDGSGYGVG